MVPNLATIPWVKGVPIDPPESSDRDDAIWVKETETGYRLQVSVASVADKIGIGTPHDAEAYRMGFTRYRLKSHRPMLGRHMETQLSLTPNQTRIVLAVSINLSSTLEVIDTTVERRLLRCPQKVSYEEVVGIIKTGEGMTASMLRLLKEVALGLLARRKARGALAVYDISRGWVVTEDGTIKKLRQDEMTVGYVMVQESMILANAELARFAAEQSIPVLFRNHTARPSAPKLQEIGSQVELMMEHPETYTPATLNRRLSLIMEAASYGPHLLGHYALDLPAYGHFTSPIRRYADLVNHRQILAFLDGQPYPYNIEQLAECGEHLNNRAIEIKGTNGMHYRQQEKEQGRKDLSEGYLEQLDNSRFRMVVRYAIEDGSLTAALEAALRLRLKANKMTPRDFVVLLHETAGLPEWSAVKSALATSFTKNPPNATQTLMVGNATGIWSELSWSHNPTTGAYGVHVAYQGGKFSYEMPWTRGAKTSRAKHHVSCQLLSAMFDLGDIGGTAPVATPSLPSQDSIELKRSIPTKNHKGRLGEICQALDLEQALYTTTHTGPDNERQFHCVAHLKYEGKEYVSKQCPAPRKKDAEQLAAHDLLIQIGHYQ